MNAEQNLQADVIIWFSQAYPDSRGHLWGNFATQDLHSANFKKSLGLVAFLSDIMYVTEGADREFWGIELKTPGSRHSVSHVMSQAKWLLSIPNKGFFCDSFEMFQDIIHKKSHGIDPALVLKNCRNIKTKTASWETMKKID